MKRQRLYSLGTKITEEMKKALDEYLTRNAHVNPADYVRDLVRSDLKKKGYINE